MGALTYRPAWDVRQDAKLTDLDELSAKCQAILNREDVADLDAVFQMGGSSGGARPNSAGSSSHAGMLDIATA